AAPAAPGTRPGSPGPGCAATPRRVDVAYLVRPEPDAGQLAPDKVTQCPGTNPGIRKSGIADHREYRHEPGAVAYQSAQPLLPVGHRPMMAGIAWRHGYCGRHGPGSLRPRAHRGRRVAVPSADPAAHGGGRVRAV